MRRKALCVLVSGCPRVSDALLGRVDTFGEEMHGLVPK